MTKPWLSVVEAARLLDVAPNNVRRWTQKGYLVAVLLPDGTPRYERAKVERLRQTLWVNSAGSKTARPRKRS